MTSGDPLERLSVLNPFADECAAYTDVDDARLARILKAAPGADDRRRGRRWWVAGVGLVVAVTAAFAVVHRQQVSNPVGVVCYRVADVDGDRALVEFAEDAVGACGVPWSDGTFSTDGPPALVACVNDAGLAAVFPGDESTCSKLRLAEYDAKLGDDERRVAELQDVMSTVFEAQCFRQSAALAKAQELLDASGLTGWSVQLAEEFPQGRECGFATPMAGSKTVIVGGGRAAP